MNGEQISDQLDTDRGNTERTPLLKNKKNNRSGNELTINMSESYDDFNNENNRSEKIYQAANTAIWLISRGRGYRIIKMLMDYCNSPLLKRHTLNDMVKHEESQIEILQHESKAEKTTDELAPQLLTQHSSTEKIVEPASIHENYEIHYGIYPSIDSFFNGVYFVTNKVWPTILIPLLITKNIPYGVDIIPIISAPLIWGFGNFLKHYTYNKLYNLQRIEELQTILGYEPQISLLSTFDPQWCALHNAKYAILCDTHLSQNQKNELFNQIVSLNNKNPLYRSLIFDTIADICDFSRLTSDDTKEIDFLIKAGRNVNATSFIENINKYYAKFKLSSLGLNSNKSENVIFYIIATLFFGWTGVAKGLILYHLIRTMKDLFSHTVSTPKPTITPMPTPTSTPTLAPTPLPTNTSTPAPTPTPPITTISPPTNSSTPTPTPSISPTPTPTNSSTPTPTPSISPTPTPTNSTTPLPTISPNTTCIEEGKEWLYMPEYSEMICSMCGDLPVYINDIDNVQGCVSGLLAQPQTPEYILSSLNKLTRFANVSNLHKIDVSQQPDWSNWNTTTFGEILNIFSRLTSYLDTFDGSQSVPNTNFVDNGNLQKLAEFSHSVILNKIILRNLGAGTALTQSFLNNSYIEQTTYYDFMGNNITDLVYADLCKNLPSNLTTFIVSNNNITDVGFAQCAQNIANSTIKHLDISYNSITQEFSKSLITIVKKGILQFLKFVGNDLTGVDLTAFWQATTQNSSLSHVDLTNTNLNDGQLSSMAPYANQTSINDFILRNNPYGDAGVGSFMPAARNSQIRKVDFSFSLVSGNGINNIAQNLPYTNITSVILDGIQIANTNLQQLVNGLIESIVDHLSLQFNYLDDVSASILKGWLNTLDKIIKVLDISNNQFTDVGGVVLANATINSTIAEIRINNNQLSSVTGIAFANSLPNNNLKALIANGCNFGPDTAVALSNVIDQCDLESLDIGNNPLLNGTFPLALKLITATPDPNSLSEVTLSAVEANAFNAAKPASKITKIILNDSEMDASTVRATCRALFKANITRNNFNVDDNPVDPEDVNLKNCRFNQTSPSFNIAPTSQYYLRPNVTNYNSNSSQTAVLGLGSVIIIVPAIIFAVIALYLIYKALHPSATKISAKAFGLFSKSEKNSQSVQIIFDKNKDSDETNKQNNKAHIK